MADCIEKLPLSWLKEKVDQDALFAAESLVVLERRRNLFRGAASRETFTTASSSCALIDRWLRDGELKGYVRGNPVDTGALSVAVPVESHDDPRANLEDLITIHRDELTVLLKREGMTVPEYLLASSASSVDWSFWKTMGRAKDWEACALSLNIDPTSLKHHPQAWMAGPDVGPIFTAPSFASQGLQERFEKRLRLLRANRFDHAKFSLPMALNSNLGPGEVLLPEFATWGLSVGWNDMPPEMAVLAKRHDAPGTPELQRVVPVVTSDEWSELEDREEAARHDPEYRASSDRAAELYAERDQLLEYARQGLPVSPQVKQRLSEIRLELADHEARVDAVAARFQERGKNAYEGIPVDSSTSMKAGETSGDSHIRLLPNGGDSLTPMIWEICYNLRDAGQKVTPKPVMAELKMRAEKRMHPLVGNVLGGVAYEYDKGEETELDSEQLRGRIKEWRKKTGN